jgi:hypothetical protein
MERASIHLGILLLITSVLVLPILGIIRRACSGRKRGGPTDWEFTSSRNWFQTHALALLDVQAARGTDLRIQEAPPKNVVGVKSWAPPNTGAPRETLPLNAPFSSCRHRYVANIRLEGGPDAFSKELVIRFRYACPAACALAPNRKPPWGFPIWC